MFVIDKHNKIVLTKGDNAEFDVHIYNKDQQEVIMKDTDHLVMTVKKSATSELGFMLTAFKNTFYILPEHTKNLIPGLYVYDIQYTNTNGEISTIVPVSYFEILEEVSTNE